MSVGARFALMLSVAVIVLVVIGIFGGRWLIGGGTAVPQFAGTSTETAFNKDVVQAIDKDSPALTAGYFRDEWPAARSVHKIIAYTIARCAQIDIDQMPRNSFSALFLDLRPDGGHMWANNTSTISQQNPDKVSLTPYQQTLLAISDTIAQARIAAAKGADNFYPNMIKFGWAAVIVSALATMFVTLKSSLTAPDSTQKDTYKWYVMSTSVFVVGFLAIALSTASTILAGAKQFWDPTAAYMRNEAALVALRQLHADIALDSIAHMDGNCNSTEKDTSQEAKVTRWVSTLVSLQPGTVAAPVLIPSTSNSQISSPAVIEPSRKEPQPNSGNGANSASLNSQPPGAQPVLRAQSMR